MKLNPKKHDTDTNYTNTNNSLMLKMVTSYSIFLLVILLLSFVVYQASLNNTRNLHNLQNKTSLTNNVELFETDLKIMEVYCRQLLLEKNFRKIMNATEADNTFISNANEMRNILAANIYQDTLLPVKESFCYFPLTDYILNSTHLITQDRFYNDIQYYPADKQDYWLNFHSDPKYQNRFLLMEDFSEQINRTWDFYMYIINMNDLFYMDANATVSFIIDPDAIIEMFDCLSADSGFLLVVDQNNKQILTVKNDTSYDVDSILALDYSDEFASYKTEQGPVTIGKYVATGGYYNYTYYYSFPTFDSTTNTGFIKFVFLFILLITLIAGIIAISYLSKRNVQPIIELGQELHDAIEAQNHLQETLDNQRPIICTSYIRQLMSGSITSEEEASYIHDYLELGSSSVYNVLYVVVYNNGSDSNGNLPTDRDTPEELQNIIMNALQNFFGSELYFFRSTDRTYSVLLHCDRENADDFVLKMSNIILRLHDYMLETYEIWLFAGIGCNTDSLMNVWESYQQATEAVNYTNKNYIFYPYEFIRKKSDAFYYPPEISTKLIHFISTGNTAQVLELINLIHHENIEERSLPINLLKYLLSDIRNTLLKARFALPSNTDPETVKLLDERFNEHLSFKLCEDLALTLCELFTNESDNLNLAATIEKYITQNYQDPSLGLNKISDEFQISESYFSHMFKEKTGVNFSTYLENIRMAEAARLIKETDISLNELFIAVGYNNANSFRRAFKKVYGVTPSAMREQK